MKYMMLQQQMHNTKYQPAIFCIIYIIHMKGEKHNGKNAS